MDIFADILLFALLIAAGYVLAELRAIHHMIEYFWQKATRADRREVEEFEAGLKAAVELKKKHPDVWKQMTKGTWMEEKEEEKQSE